MCIIFQLSFLVLLALGESSNRNEEYTDNYDFIIVGSGSSGLIIANRLSEISSWRILLLEAGNPGNFFTKIPALAPLLQLTPYNWNYTMQQQKNVCLAMEEQICAWPRGKALGGTTVINYMVYTRGNPEDYNKWARQGNDGWSYDEVLPYFIKSENCNLGFKQCSGPYHQTGGYLSVEYPFKSKLTDAFLQAGVEMGEQIVDYNTPNFMGFSRVQATIKNGRRHSTADAFLFPIENHRNNLQILTSARVTKILIDPNTKKAYGVEFRRNKKKYIVKATKEIILAAGVLNSPQLLMLSGIGPRDHLQELNIPLIKDLPVGQLLYDHIGFIGLTLTMNQTIESKEAFFDIKEKLKWFLDGKGVYTSLGGVEALAYINTKNSTELYPDIELVFLGIGFLNFDHGLVVARETRVKKSVYNRVFKPIEQVPSLSILPMLLHPKSKGYLKLRSKRPYDKPLFYGNYFTDPDNEDLRTLLASIRYIQKLTKTPAFRKYNLRIHDIPIPGCETNPFDSDPYWICALRSLTTTLHHQIGTCKMGPKNDKGAVVDPRFKVYGIEGLRVADSSVIPVTLSAHTNAPTIMIGEKASDVIKQDWGLLKSRIMFTINDLPIWL